MSDIQENIDLVAKDIRYGKLFIEATIHDGRMTSSNITMPTRNKKYSAINNTEPAEDFLNLLKWAQDNSHSGTITFTAIMDEGIIKKASHDEIRRGVHD